MKTKRENEKEEERKEKTSIIISPRATKTIMLTRMKIQTITQVSSSFSFSSPTHTK